MSSLFRTRKKSGNKMSIILETTSGEYFLFLSVNIQLYFKKK